MNVFRAAGYAAGLMFSAALDSSRPRDQHRDYDRALRRAEDALVDAEAERDVLEPAESIQQDRCDVCNRSGNLILGICDDCDRDFEALDLEDEAWDANEEFDARREERTNTWMREVCSHDLPADDFFGCADCSTTVSPVEGSGDATGGVTCPPSVVPLSEQVDQVADELRAQHQPNWLADKTRALAAMLKTQGL